LSVTLLATGTSISGLTGELEQYGLYVDGKRPDVSFSGFIHKEMRGKTLIIDVTVAKSTVTVRPDSSTATILAADRTNRAAAAQPGYFANRAKLRKESKYSVNRLSSPPGTVFHSFEMESRGRFGVGALNVLDILAKEFIARGKGTHAEFFARVGPSLSMAFWRGTIAKIKRWHSDDYSFSAKNQRPAHYANNAEARQDQYGSEMFRTYDTTSAWTSSPIST